MKKYLFFLGLVPGGLFCLPAQPAGESGVYFDTAEAVVATAKEHIGVPYSYGGRNPETGFDCSGFVHYVFAQHSVDLPVISAEYIDVGTEIVKEQSMPGDIILFAGRNADTTPVGHVGIITERNETDIFFIHSATSRKRGIVISPLSVNYYSERFVSVRRVFYDSN